MANIAVIGTGYVGLTTGAYLAHLGHYVVCADVIPEKVESLHRGIMPILEAGLDELVKARGSTAGASSSSSVRRRPSSCPTPSSSSSACRPPRATTARPT